MNLVDFWREGEKKGFDFKKFAQTLDEVTALRLEKVDLLARIDKLNAEIDHEISNRINELNARYQGENESLHLAVKFARSENEKLNTEYFELKARYQELTAKYQTMANQPEISGRYHWSTYGAGLRHLSADHDGGRGDRGFARVDQVSVHYLWLCNRSSGQVAWHCHHARPAVRR